MFSSSFNTNYYPKRLIDKFGRRLHYLRLSITDRCNLRCIYCSPKQGITHLPYNEILTLEELYRLSSIAISLGVDKIRLTGGEPLMRRHLSTLLSNLNTLTPRPDLRLTTNGLLLENNLKMLITHKISTINVSLDTLKPERYGMITGQSFKKGLKNFACVWSGIEAALKSKKIAVKINTVLLSGINEDEIIDFARLTFKKPLTVRFIEYMPIGRHTPFKPNFFLSAKKVLTDFKKLGELISLPPKLGDGPAQRYRLHKAIGEIGIITALTSHFCLTCNRLRLSAEGLLVPCLFSEQTIDIKTVLRTGANNKQLATILLNAATAKTKQHNQTLLISSSVGCQMSRLGG